MPRSAGITMIATGFRSSCAFLLNGGSDCYCKQGFHASHTQLFRIKHGALDTRAHCGNAGLENDFSLPYKESGTVHPRCPQMCTTIIWRMS
jgi:hypothetical protein